MKNLSQEVIFNLFKDAGCQLLSEYKKCNIPLIYICKCGKKGEITLDKFRKRIKRGGGCAFCGKKEWTKNQDECLKNLYGKVPRKLILESIPGMTYSDIKNRANNLGLKGNRRLVSKQINKKRKYHINDSYFNVIRSEASYWAGFMASSGIINYNKNQISINVFQEDLVHLELFKKTIDYNGKIYDFNGKLSLQIHGVGDWIFLLENNYQITTRKHLHLKPPFDLDELNSMSYIIGYIDGCCEISLDNDSMKMFGTIDVLSWIKNWFDYWCPCVQRRYAVIRMDRNDRYFYCLSGKRANYILNKMINNDLPFLERKWKRGNDN